MKENPKPERGSSKLILERWKTREFGEGEVRELLKSLDVDGVELLEYFPIGIPAPEVIHGTIRVNPKKIGPLLERWLDLNVAWRKWEVFPIGIPVPDDLLIKFESVAKYR
jgi:hypothetical protein